MTAIPKCRICREREGDIIWQPFGPDESHLCFTTPGSHYRGFPAVRVCFRCKFLIEMGAKGSIVFRYKYKLYWVSDTGVQDHPVQEMMT